jgi:type VI secretion system protein ImpF
MARGQIERTAQPSVLDRLIDTDPRMPADPPMTLAQSVRLVKDGLRRDLEWLLNSRRTIEVAPPEMRETRQSVYHYGIPDLSSMAADSAGERARLLRHIEEAVSLFEPRLVGVRVTLVEDEADAKGMRQLRFVIEATLQMDPTPERVAFDTVLDVTSLECRVRGERGA